jgi:hypothetical protein
MIGLKIYLPKVSGSRVAHLMVSSVTSDHSLSQAAVGMQDLINVFPGFGVLTAVVMKSTSSGIQCRVVRLKSADVSEDTHRLYLQGGIS